MRQVLEEFFSLATNGEAEVQNSAIFGLENLFCISSN